MSRHLYLVIDPAEKNAMYVVESAIVHTPDELLDALFGAHGFEGSLDDHLDTTINDITVVGEVEATVVRRSPDGNA